MKVRKAVIPAAGYGTRFLPATKSMPKEMLPVVDKPVVQYVVEEAVSAGIEEIIFVTSSNKHALEDHFDNNFELEEQLKRSGKMDQYEKIRAISNMARFVYVRQKEARGNGHAVLVAKDLIGDEPFLVLWGDEFITAEPTRSIQLVERFNEKQSPVITVLESSEPTDAYKYAFAKGEWEEDLYRVHELIEKPGSENVPSNLASVGGYLLTPDIFPVLEETGEHKGEIWLTHAINTLAAKRAVYATKLQDATYYDSGSKFGLIKANIDFGLNHPETREQLLAYLEELRDA